MIGSEVLLFNNLPSTNTYAANLLRTKELAEGTIIRAEFQLSGRGQMGNGWESESGKNLLVSIILYPKTIQASDQFLISMAISLGLSDFLDKEFSGCKIKWPNDIYVKNDKIAGILIENSIIDNSIISTIAGIGLNINQCKFTGNIPNPVSMRIITGKDYNIEFCLEELSKAIDKRYYLLLSGKYNIIRNDYNSKLYRFREWSYFRDSKSSYKGKIVSVNESGMLIIERPNGESTEYSFKEVEFIP